MLCVTRGYALRTDGSASCIMYHVACRMVEIIACASDFPFTYLQYMVEDEQKSAEKMKKIFLRFLVMTHSYPLFLSFLENGLERASVAVSYWHFWTYVVISLCPCAILKVV